jgi:RNA polymerase subunit RPABC4/transcription elongation factor Spt4
MILKIGGEGKIIEIKACPDCEGMTCKDYCEKKGITYLEWFASIFGVDPTREGIAKILAEQLGFNVKERGD